MTTTIPQKIAEMLAELTRANASDLLLTVGSPPMARIDGAMVALEGQTTVDERHITELLEQLIPDHRRDLYTEGVDADFSFGWGENVRIRANAFHQRGYPAVVLRIMPREAPSFDALGLPESVRGFAELSHGLILVTGPTGSGKSTTLASLIDCINETRQLHILTIEDPIEYEHMSKKSVVNQRAVGDDTPSFAAALRSSLRETPDVIMVGELRDLESMQAALTLAEVGHLVLATLHTNDTGQAVDRLIDTFPAGQQSQIRAQLANCLTAIVHQRLLPRVSGGRAAAFEVLIATPPVRNLIREDHVQQLRNQLITGQRDGMMTLEMSLKRLYGEGLITFETAAAQTSHLSELR